MIPFGTRLLWQRTRDYVNVYQPMVIGVTGATGSALTHTAITMALAHEYRMRAVTTPLPITKRNVALTLLGIKPPRLPHHWWSLLSQSLMQELKEVEPEVIPLVLTAEQPGLLDWISQQLTCQVVVITDVSSRHNDLFETRELIAHEQASLVVTLPASSLAVLNQDEPLIADLKDKTQAQVITYGYSREATIQVQRIQRLSSGGLATTVKTAGQTIELHFPYLLSNAQVMSAVAALAVALGLQVPLKPAVQALQKLKPMAGHLQRLTGIDQTVVLNNSRVKTPEELINALEVLRALPGHRRIALLGDIQGLGKDTYTWHKKIGKLAGEVAQIVIGVGELMRLANVESIVVGADTHHFNTSEDAAAWLLDYIQPEDVILVAGSAHMKMGKIVNRLVPTDNVETGI